MFVDAEALFGDFFRANLPGQVVSAEVPNPRPVKLLQCWRTGGSASNPILDRPILTVTVWGAGKGSRGDVSDRANLARNLVLDPSTTRRLALARRVEEVSGLYFDPDGASEDPRYTFAFRAFLRAKF